MTTASTPTTRPAKGAVTTGLPVTVIQTFQQPVGILTSERAVGDRLLDRIAGRLFDGCIHRSLDVCQVYASFFSQVCQGFAAPQLGGELIGRHARAV